MSFVADWLRRRRVARRHPRRRVELSALPPFEMAVHRRFDRYVSYAIHELGVWEPFETAIVRRLLSPGHVFVDIGANIGWYSLVAALSVGPEGRVFSFEPDPENFAVLSHNLRHNLRGAARRAVISTKTAASDRNGTGRIYLSPDNLGDHHIYPTDDRAASAKIREVRLDDFLRGFDRPLNVVKVDTQGAEPKVFDGAQDRLLGDRPILVTEFWPYGMDASGRSVDEVLAFLSRFSGECFVIDESAERLHPVALDRLSERARNDLHPDTRNFVDLVVVPQDDPRRALLAQWIDNPVFDGPG